MRSERRKGMKREGEWEWGGELERHLKLLKETYFMSVEMSGMGETIKINFKHPSSCKVDFHPKTEELSLEYHRTRPADHQVKNICKRKKS
ncbi:unnamed protein product [Prunus brigantina]